ncbi:MAG: hypothetical protein K0A95_09240 [Chromatiales bacterium]|nr:hypothetical protein [Chromatiales bacterium]
MLRSKPVIFFMVWSAVLGVVSWVHAAEDAGHFKGKPAETLEQAVANFTEGNRELGSLLAGELDAKRLYEIHQLTYTLEVALAKIIEEASELAEVLEEVHVATEKNDAKTAASKGREYLDTAGKLIK